MEASGFVARAAWATFEHPEVVKGEILALSILGIVALIGLIILL